MIRLFTLLAIWLACPGLIRGQQLKYDFNARCRMAYQDIMAMKLDSGRQLAAEERRAEPANLIPELLENDADFLELFFSEDPAVRKTLEPGIESRLSLLEQGDRSSPYYLFCLAESHFQKAMECIKFLENWTAAWQFRKAYLELKENVSRFPKFAPDWMILGVMQSVIGTLPSGYRRGVGILGMSGTISGGMQEIQAAIRDTGRDAAIFRDEEYIYYIYLDATIVDQTDEAMAFARDKQLDLKSNEMFGFLILNLALNHQMGAYCQDILDSLPTGDGYFRIPILDLEKGMVELDQLNLDSAVVYLSDYALDFKGSFYIRDALLKLSWAEWLRGNLVAANRYRALIPERGTGETDADKAAMFEASQSGWPNPILLKARLLSDGGYFARAYDLLKPLHITDLPDPEDKIEYAYRMARIFDLQGHPKEAEPFYQATIRIGRSSPLYYAARASLELGTLYEKEGNRPAALACYRDCLDMKEQQYKNYLDQRAKSGINRLTGK